ncbi:MAG: DNA mismatch repair endonuclease MutL [Firmicutes bacterium]|nr:DNA mismatch repair endonuclease MutL [Bacillota bacterium]
MIKVLDKTVADKIAAGEVIERPVSIVKELVENAIDSGGDSIVVEIKNGGKTYIRVTDNGCGIPADQVETAFLRHATSKIETARDLDAILTLGFRGEALASIAAVTHTELITKPNEAKLGTKLLIHGSEVLSNAGTGCPDGTTIIVTDLFYNTPARQKFLKSDAAESGQIIDFMSQIALAYPNIKIRFINNGNIVFSTTGNGDVLGAILAVYKMKEYQDLVPVSYEEDGVKVTGYISRPSLSRTNRRNQIFFVKGRVVNSKVIERGVTTGYRERLFEGRYPICFLFIETDPGRLDVNIHPNKREVRFDREEEIVHLVAKAIKAALGTKAAVVEAKNIFKDEKAPSAKAEEKKQEQVNIKQLLSTKREAEKTTVVREPEFTYGAPANHESDVPKARPASSTLKPDILPAKAVEKPAVTPVVLPSEKQQPVKPAITLETPGLQPFDFADLRLTGSVFNTYITAEDGQSFYLIDQHAAHERIFYEKLVGEYLAEEKLRQPILTPIMVEVPLAVKENEYDWLDSLTEMGFSIHNFGQNTYIIKEIPTFMSISEAEDFVNTFIDSVSEGTKLANTIIINKLITKSCKSAVKANDHLSLAEMEALMQQLATCKNPFSCPHGRPTFIRMTKYQIEKMFKRV